MSPKFAPFIDASSISSRDSDLEHDSAISACDSDGMQESPMSPTAAIRKHNNHSNNNNWPAFGQRRPRSRSASPGPAKPPRNSAQDDTSKGNSSTPRCIADKGLPQEPREGTIPACPELGVEEDGVFIADPGNEAVVDRSNADEILHVLLDLLLDVDESTDGRLVAWHVASLEPFCVLGRFGSPVLERIGTNHNTDLEILDSVFARSKLIDGRKICDGVDVGPIFFAASRARPAPELPGMLRWQGQLVARQVAALPSAAAQEQEEEPVEATRPGPATERLPRFGQVLRNNGLARTKVVGQQPPHHPFPAQGPYRLRGRDDVRLPPRGAEHRRLPSPVPRPDEFLPRRRRPLSLSPPFGA